MTDVPLKRTPDGYVTPDGRFAVLRITSGHGRIRNGDWSPGRTVWCVEDTTGAAFRPRDWATVDTLPEARQLIADVRNREEHP